MNAFPLSADILIRRVRQVWIGIDPRRAFSIEDIMTKKAIACVAFAFASATSAVHAGTPSELQPGLTTGIALGAAGQLPPGVYDVVIGNYGSRNSSPGNIDDLGAVVPSWLIWSTPWTIAGGRLLFDTATPYVDLAVKDGPSMSGFANTIFDAQLKWDLGGGFYGGFQAGVYLPSRTAVGRDLTSFQGIAALSYLKDGWNLSTSVIYGTGGTAGGVDYSDWLNIDLTATRKFGPWELGAVAFYSTDLGARDGLSQLALGPLVGYDFGSAIVQLKLTRDVYERGYEGHDTRAAVNISFPIWVGDRCCEKR